MLVDDEDAEAHFAGVGADLVRNFEIWIREIIGVSDVQYRSHLNEQDMVSKDTVVVATYPWIINRIHDPLHGGGRYLLGVIRHARKLGAPIWCPIIDVFSVRYSFYASCLAGFTGGANILIQNSVEQAKLFGLVNPSGPHFWLFPPSVQKTWAPSPLSSKRQRIVLIAQSGDERRVAYYSRAFRRFEDYGYKAVATSHQMSWPEYVSTVKSSTISCATCWLQPLFLKGPPRFRERLADGHITARVWEAFASGNLLVTESISALEILGFFPGQHFVSAPSEFDNWQSWEPPNDEVILQIAQNGHEKFLSLLKEEWARHRIRRKIETAP